MPFVGVRVNMLAVKIQETDAAALFGDPGANSRAMQAGHDGMLCLLSCPFTCHCQNPRLLRQAIAGRRHLYLFFSICCKAGPESGMKNFGHFGASCPRKVGSALLSLSVQVDVALASLLDHGPGFGYGGMVGFACQTVNHFTMSV